MLSYTQRCGVLLALALLSLLALLWVGPIAQDPAYHLFADTRRLAGINNFWNVMSNVPFLLVGAVGLQRLARLSHPESTAAYRVICFGVVLGAFGSAWYHWAPNNASLLWDRLPMTVAFMALFAMLLSERVLRTRQPSLLWVLVTLGVAAAVYWAWTESLGRGDLRPYALIQFLPIVLMPVILALFPQRYLDNRLLIAAFALYLLAKVLEHFDVQVFAATGLMSGHALKHLAAAAAVLCIIYAIPTRPAGQAFLPPGQK
ncbi:MAG: hypothetical protein HKO64_01795 [Xanthomonadales bacterium]|nr:hypothetical protein [Xanthomonadales bacterium]